MSTHSAALWPNLTVSGLAFEPTAVSPAAVSRKKQDMGRQETFRTPSQTVILNEDIRIWKPRLSKKWLRTVHLQADIASLQQVEAGPQQNCHPKHLK